jgi:hypothetical protein
MKQELYLSPRERKELQAAVRERTITVPGERPKCERCGQVNGKLKRNKQGYLTPQWLHTSHRKGAPLLSKNPDDYFCLCPKCHMAYDRSPDDSGFASRYRTGYAVTTTDQLLQALAGVGLQVWGVVEEGWYWKFDNLQGGPEETPSLAVAAAWAKAKRLSYQAAV